MTSRDPHATIDEHGLLDHVLATVRAQVGDLPRQLVVDYYVSLKANRFVVLTGPERCGKTAFAAAVAAALVGPNTPQYAHVAGSDWTSRTGDPADYAQLHAQYSALRLLDTIHAAAQPTSEGRLFVLSMARLQPDELTYYLAGLLRVQERETRLNLPGFPPDQQPLVPPNVLITATVNTSDWGRRLHPAALRHAGLIAYRPPKDPMTSAVPPAPPPPGYQRLWLRWALRGLAARERLTAVLPPDTLSRLPPAPALARLLWRAGLTLGGRAFAEMETYAANSFAADGRGLFDPHDPIRNARIAVEAQITQRVLWKLSDAPDEDLRLGLNDYLASSAA